MRDDLVRYVDDHLLSRQCTGCRGRRFDEAQLLDALSSELGAYNRGTRKQQSDCASPFEPHPQTLFIEKDVEQTHLCLAFPGCTFAQDERFSLAVLNNVLGGGMSSRLFQSIREDKGLAYSVYSYPSSYSYSGHVFALCRYNGGQC